MFSDSTWTWSLPADGSLFLFSNRLLMTNQWILWAILHPILRETPHWQKMKTWWHGSCRIAIPCHTGMYIHVYSVLLCLCHYVQYETGDSHGELHTSRSKDIPWTARGCHRAFSSPLNKDVLIRCRNKSRNHVHQTHKTMAILWPWQCYATYAYLFYSNKHRMLVGLTKPTFTPKMVYKNDGHYESHVWRVGSCAWYSMGTWEGYKKWCLMETVHQFRERWVNDPSQNVGQ